MSPVMLDIQPEYEGAHRRNGAVGTALVVAIADCRRCVDLRHPHGCVVHRKICGEHARAGEQP